jgi:hypothetical protein
VRRLNTASRFGGLAAFAGSTNALVHLGTAAT